MQTNNIKNQKRVMFFPKNSGAILTTVLEKYKLEENAESIIKKMQNKQKSNAFIIAKLTRQVARKKISTKQFTDALKTELNIPTKKAEQVSHEIKEKILNKAKMIQEIEKPLSNSKAISPSNITPLKEPTDVYREAVK